MNRRSFIQTLGAAVASFAILPSAKLYDRKWVKKNDLYVINADWATAEYEISWIISGWNKAIEGGPFPKHMGDTILFIE